MKLSEIDWDELRAHIITRTGWTWEYVGQYVTLPRLQALNAYWSKNPPMAGLANLGAGGLFIPAAPPQYGTLDEFAADWISLGGRV